ncbi:Hypothetical Protein FCC1311_113472 [Hondaea fermentalgiana]|uniref:Uncharacterized protein n=1 Tax=Hondaea fermentalgiana TaxID=2315210 RepID=A0A2R5H3W1_9STRA|nr:Hypothetical Protein FCC1311_113472 [Hondaea fermentalgiana]|eukprot:GBG35124.1 Hypothetical Protein FCC1311_113472 [Hondaea fermentalgiana]
MDEYDEEEDVQDLNETQNEEDAQDLNEAQDEEYAERRALFLSEVDEEVLDQLNEEGDLERIVQINDDLDDLTSFYGSDFASCEGLAYSREECESFIGEMSEIVVNRVNLQEMPSYSQRVEAGDGETPIQVAFNRLAATLQEALKEGGLDPSSELSSGRRYIHDPIAHTTRYSDATFSVGDKAVCLVELKTKSTFGPKALEEFEPPKDTKLNKVKVYNKLTKKTTTASFEAAGDPLAQICCYMACNECRYGILSNWGFTYFLKLEMAEDGSMVLHYSDRFCPLTQQGQESGRVCAVGNELLGEVVRKVVAGDRPASLVVVEVDVEVDVNVGSEAIPDQIKVE